MNSNYTQYYKINLQFFQVLDRFNVASQAGKSRVHEGGYLKSVDMKKKFKRK